MTLTQIRSELPDAVTCAHVELHAFKREADAAAARGDMNAHMVFGKAFHEVADIITALTGSDPRPADEALDAEADAETVTELIKAGVVCGTCADEGERSCSCWDEYRAVNPGV